MTKFEKDFRAAIHKTNRYGLANLVDLRRELPQYTREQFDGGLRQLVARRVATMAAAQSTDGITDAERAAGIPNGRGLDLWVSLIG